MSLLLESPSVAEAHCALSAVADEAIAARGAVLLLEDDVSFRGVIADFLTECGFAVVALRNGAEGIREIVASDFTAILCDMMMPTVSGEMFYRAVERVRPNLCRRFIFMSGHRQDSKMSEFIEKTNGLLIQKPFALKDLLDLISLAEVRSTYVSVFDSTPVDPNPSRGFRAVDSDSERSESCPEEPEVADELPVSAPHSAETLRTGAIIRGNGSGAVGNGSAQVRSETSAFREFEHPSRSRVISRAFAFTALALLIVLAVYVGIRIPRAQDGAAAASSELLALETQWKLVSAQQNQSENARSEYWSLRERAERLTDESQSGKWVEALRIISKVASPAISLDNIASHGGENPRGGCRILIHGFATGGAPRLVAEAFCDALDSEVKGSLTGAVVTQLEMFEDEPRVPSAPSGRRRVRFKIALTVGPAEPRSKEGGAAR